jgi:hypothetical protein
MHERVERDNVVNHEDTDMKPPTKPHSMSITRWVYRAWLRSRIDTYTRSLHAIAVQRENDFHAERILHRAISTTRSKLQSL